MRFSVMYAVLMIAAAAGPGGAADRWTGTYQAGLDLFENREYPRARGMLLDALLEAQVRRPADWTLPATLHTLGITEQALGQYGDARAHLEAAVDLWPGTGDHGRQASITRESLGCLLSDAGEPDAASREFLAALSLKERIYGASSIEVGSTLVRVAESYISRGQIRRAQPLLRRALDIQTPLLPAGDRAVLATRIMLAHVLRSLGDFEAARLHASAAEEAGQQSSLYPEILAVLGDVYRREGNPARAVPLLRRAITLAAARDSERELPAAVLSLAYIDLVEGRPAAARDGFERGLTMIQRLWGPDRPEAASAQIGLAVLMLEERRPEEASALLEAAQPLIESAFPEDRLFQTTEIILRAALAQARGDRNSASDAIRSAWSAIEREKPRTQQELWEISAALLRPYRPDLAKAAAKRSKALRRGIPGERTASEFENQRGN